MLLALSPKNGSPMIIGGTMRLKLRQLLQFVVGVAAWQVVDQALAKNGSVQGAE
eukprot:COSAG04_NODE_11073_length_732_cov_12.478673_1_plen_53_part_10